MSESLTLSINQKAPHFKLMDVYDREIDLQSYLGKKVLVGFFRHAGCPFCNVRVHRLQRKMEELRSLGLEMIFFFESEKEVLLSKEFHQKISPIPLIADPDKTWYDAYGVESSARKSTISHVTQFFQTVVRAKINGLPVHMMKGKESINTIPAEFLIDEKGEVKHVHYAKDLNDRIHLDVIFQFAKTGTVRV
jgi:peroxiredoxin Q/BCP